MNITFLAEQIKHIKQSNSGFDLTAVYLDRRQIKELRLSADFCRVNKQNHKKTDCIMKVCGVEIREAQGCGPHFLMFKSNSTESKAG